MNELHPRNFGCWTRLLLVGACLDDRSGRLRGLAHKENRNVQSRLASVVMASCSLRPYTNEEPERSQEGRRCRELSKPSRGQL